MRTALAVLLLFSSAGCSRLVDLDGLTGGERDAGRDAGAFEGGAGDANVDARPPHDAGPDATPPDGGDGGSIEPEDAGQDAAPDAGPTCPTNDGKMALIETSRGTYCIDETEVTQRRYQAFLDDLAQTGGLSSYFESSACINFVTDVKPLDPWPQPGKGDFPVGGVTYCGAEAYCNWADKALCGQVGGEPALPGFFNDPRDAWWRACAGPEGRVYPYGDTFDMDACNGAGRFGNMSFPAGELENCVSVDGVFDMSGNVWEWVKACDADANTSDVCRARGGSNNASATELACDYKPRELPRAAQIGDVGFRCCVDLQALP